MRDEFISELLISARIDPNIMLVVGDLGFGVIDEFAEELSEQFLNVGIAEQSMLGVASGLAMAGSRVFVYSIANFPTFRALEQIRNDVCYHNLDVTVVSVGAGLSYGTLGYSHHAVEDISVMRVLPNMRVVSPADGEETRASVRMLASTRGPAYLRLGRAERDLHGDPLASVLDPLELRTGRDAVVLATGSVVAECLSAAELLSQKGVSVAVYSCPNVEPINLEWCADVPRDTLLVSVEEHTLPGGFGAAVLERLNRQRLDRRVLRLGLDHQLNSIVGSAEYLRGLHGISDREISSAIYSFLLTDL